MEPAPPSPSASPTGYREAKIYDDEQDTLHAVALCQDTDPRFQGSKLASTTSTSWSRSP